MAIPCDSMCHDRDHRDRLPFCFVQMDHDYRFDLIRFSCFFMMISDDCLNNKFEAQKRKFRLLLAVLFCLFRLSVCCWA